MSSGGVEDRIHQLEQKVRQLESDILPDVNTLPWWDRIAGAFKDDQVYAEAMKLGAEIRKNSPSEEVPTTQEIRG